MVCRVLSGDSKTGDGRARTMRERANTASGSYWYRRTVSRLSPERTQPSQLVGDGAVGDGAVREGPPARAEG